MHESQIQQHARRNIKLYPVQKVFNKRVFLPIIPIFYVEYVGFSIPEIGVLAAFWALMTMLFNIPSGYFADRFGRTKALRAGATMLMISTTIYAGFPTKTGIIIGVIFEAVGFAFISGAGESLAHDSLEVLDRKRDYSKVLSRAQSLALVANAALVATVPLTYAIDPRLPFVVGIAAFAVLLATTLAMKDVMTHAAPKKISWRGLNALEKLSSNKLLFATIMLFGIVGAIYFAFDIIAIALREFGVSPEYLGWVYAAASLFGAALGLVVHKLKQMSLGKYILVDIVILLAVYAAGYSQNVWFLIAAAIVSVSFWRFRRIIYQDHLLERFPGNYKATLISVMNTSESLNLLWVPIATTAAIGGFGVANGFGLIGIAATIIGAIYYVLMYQSFIKKRHIEPRELEPSH